MQNFKTTIFRQTETNNYLLRCVITLSAHWTIAGFKHLRPEHRILLPKVTLDLVEACYFTLYDQSIATCNGGNITISSDAIRESSERITDSTRTPSIVENIVGANHCNTH